MRPASSADTRRPFAVAALNGAPGVRHEYSGRYYAAFVPDPDGNNVEAVFHEPAAVDEL